MKLLPLGQTDAEPILMGRNAPDGRYHYAPPNEPPDRYGRDSDLIIDGDRVLFADGTVATQRSQLNPTYAYWHRREE